MLSLEVPHVSSRFGSLRICGVHPAEQQLYRLDGGFKFSDSRQASRRERDRETKQCMQHWVGREEIAEKANFQEEEALSPLCGHAEASLLSSGSVFSSLRRAFP